MLNYTTTTFVNKDTDFVFGNGSAVFSGHNPVTDSEETGYNPLSTDTQKFIRVNFGPKIVNDGIVRKACLVGKEAYRANTKAKLDFNLSTTNVNTSGNIYRLVLYVRERNNNSPIFSNTWVFGGKPIIIEYNGGASVSDIMNTIKNYMLNIYGNEVFTVSNPPSSNILELEAKDQWMEFRTQDGEVEAYVEKLIPYNDTTKEPEHWAKVITITDTTSSNNVINNGNEGFGDFAHIMKDLRLPTRENTNYFGTNIGGYDEDGEASNHDLPSPTGHYTQYTIQLTSERGVLQQSAVGGVGVSRTVHVFYVESAATSAFETALDEVGIADSSRVTAVTINHATPVSPATIDDSTIADTRGTGTTATV